MHWFYSFQKAAIFLCTPVQYFAFLGAYFLEFGHRTIIISTASLVRSFWWYPFVKRSSGAKVMSVLRFLVFFCQVISPQDHNFRHRLEAVLMVVQFCSVTSCGKDYDVFFEKFCFFEGRRHEP